MPRGTPDHIPDDGLTTRQRRNRPLVIVHTGPASSTWSSPVSYTHLTLPTN